MKTTKKNVKKIKVRDFKMWLSGFLEFQGPEWTPNKEQWNLIKNKLDALEEGPESLENVERVVSKNKTPNMRPPIRHNEEYVNDMSPAIFSDPNDDVVIDDTPPVLPSQQGESLIASTQIRHHKTKITDTTNVFSNGIPKSPFL